ncbi:guanine nucleotide binding protein, alpha subunit [Cyathus striatus]|nr:guanine nucleotide binding protein, alpha subunit [Cyathus striatus]
MQALWMDGAVKSVLKRRELRLEDSAGFFLDDLDRIATRTYQPSDDDVVRARLRTLGVQEYRFQFEQIAKGNNFLPNFGKEWILYDVGGSRTIVRSSSNL